MRRPDPFSDLRSVVLFVLMAGSCCGLRTVFAQEAVETGDETSVEIEEKAEDEEETEDEILMPEWEKEKILQEKRKRRNLEYGLDLVLGTGWRENVFHGAEFDGVEDPNEDAAFLFSDLYSYLDVPMGEEWTLENELSAYFEEFDTLNAADQRGIELETEAHYRPTKEWDAWLGGQVMRRLGKEDYHFPAEELSDDYYRYDGYLGAEKQLGDSDWLRGIYRYFYKDYDEIQGAPSDDYDEHDIEARWKHRWNKDFRSYVFGEARFRYYDEKFARDREGNPVPSEIRRRNIYVYGANLYWDVARKSTLRLGIEMTHTRDPFEHYYDYDSYELSASLDHPITKRIYAEWDISFEPRDYPNRLFAVPGPNVPITKYDIYEAGFLIGYEFSDTYRVEFEYDGEWVETNLDLKTHNVQTFRIQVGISI